MAVYNGESYLKEAVDSILNQTFDDFEFLIVDDCSEDSTSRILAACTDSRIMIVSNEQNLGLTKSLNIGLSLASGKFIARMDADDVSLPIRLEEQVKYLDEHPKVGVLGSWYETNPGRETVRLPCLHEAIYACMFFYNPIAHPTVVIRRSILEKEKYNSDFKKSQDYELCQRLISKTRFANLPKVLLKYRKHEGQITTDSYDDQTKYDVLVKTELYQKVSKFDKHMFEHFWTLVRSENKMNSKECLFILKLHESLSIRILKDLGVDMLKFKKHMSDLITDCLKRNETVSMSLLIELVKSKYYWETSLKRKLILFWLSGRGILNIVSHKREHF